MPFKSDIRAGVATISINCWAISYCLDEVSEEDLSEFENIDDVIEDFCKFLEKATEYKMNRGETVNIFEMVSDEWPRFRPLLKK